MELQQSLIEYLDTFIFVNQDEVISAVYDFGTESDLEPFGSFDVSDAANAYIRLRDLHFDPDLVCTLDHKDKCLHLTDLNHQFTPEQVAKKEAQWNVAFLNACDVMYYGYPKAAWRPCGLDEEEQKRVRAAAKDYVANDF